MATTYQDIDEEIALHDDYEDRKIDLKTLVTRDFDVQRQNRSMSDFLNHLNSGF